MTTISARRARPPQLASPVAPAAVGLLEQARHGLREAAGMPAAPDRYAGAHLAALRAAAAVLAARAQTTDPRVRRRRPTSAWVLLTAVAPELSEWAAFFAAGAGKRAAAEAGVERAVTGREADDLVRDVETFVALVETTLGLLPGPRVTALAG
jgi:SAV_6107-like HEPN